MSFQPTPRVKAIADNEHLKCYAINDATGKRATATWIVGSRDNITLQIYTGNESDAIKVALNLNSFHMFMEILNGFVTGERTEPIMIHNMNFIWVNKVKSETPLLQSALLIGKDPDGVIYFIAKGVDKRVAATKFAFTPTTWHTLKNKDGSNVSPEESSKLYTKAMIKSWEFSLTYLAVTNYMHPEPKQPPSGNSNGYNGGQRQATTNTDELGMF